MTSSRIAFALLCLLSAMGLHASALAPPRFAYADPQSDDPAYASGTKAMNESRWSDAVGSFDQVLQSRSRRSDAALYWKAYALNKLGKPDLAVGTCVQLRMQFPASSWNHDCAAMKLTQTATFPGPPLSTPVIPDLARPSVPVSVASDSHLHTHDPNTDLKILALNSLLHRDPAQAIPLLRSMLTGDQSSEVKRHALFVLSQSRSPEAESTMRDLLLGKMGPELQRSAIQASGVYEGRRLNETLVEVYKSTNDPKIKQAVISAFFVSGDDAHLVDLAHAEKNMELKRTIVSQLSLMNGKAATDYMMELLK